VQTPQMKQFIQSILSKFGFRLVRVKDLPKPGEGLDHFFSLLRGLSFAPKNILDVGANHGNWTRTALKYFPDARYTLVEPQDHLRTHIQDLLDRGCKIQWINAGAGDKSGSLPFTLARRDDSCTFALTEKQAREAGFPQAAIAIKTLNEIAASTSALPPDMVKIDAEGFDLRVLAGASDLLGKTDIFLVEAEVCGPYENSVAKVVNFMAEAGYRVLDITDINRSPKFGVLWLCELAFLRDTSSLLNAVTSYE
jgi:FkbM family methyltransferase